MRLLVVPLVVMFFFPEIDQRFLFVTELHVFDLVSRPSSPRHSSSPRFHVGHVVTSGLHVVRFWCKTSQSHVWPSRSRVLVVTSGSSRLRLHVATPEFARTCSRHSCPGPLISWPLIWNHASESSRDRCRIMSITFLLVSRIRSRHSDSHHLLSERGQFEATLW